MKISRNDPCPCGSGKKYKKCCIGKSFTWTENDDGQVVRQVPLSSDVVDVLTGLRDSYVEKHGKEPDRFFQEAPPGPVVHQMTVAAMRTAKIDPALIHAFDKTGGMMLSAVNESKVTGADVQQFEDAIDEYERQTGTKAAHRRFTDADLVALLRVGPPGEG